MNIPKGVKVYIYTKWVLKTKTNIYWKRQVGRVRNKFLVEKLNSSEVGFRQSKIDECMFYWVKIMHIMYTDDYILVEPYEEELMQIVAAIRAAELDITEEGDIDDFLGFNIDKVDSKTYHL